MKKEEGRKGDKDKDFLALLTNFLNGRK